MAGIFGGCRIRDVHPIDDHLLQRMGELLTRLPGHAAYYSDTGDRHSIGVIDPGIRPRLARFTHLPASGLALGYYGDFYSISGRPAADPIASILAWYEQDSFTAAERCAALDGSFVLVIQDYNRGQLIVVNDVTATRPLFYTECAGTLYFSPELRAFAGLPGFDPAISMGCLLSLLANGSWIHDRTLLHHVRSLPQGSALVVTPDNFRIHRYWSFSFDENAPDLGLDAYVEELMPLLRRAVAKRLACIPDPGRMVIPISGGYDSRALLACVREAYGGELHTVTWGTDEADPLGDGYIGRKVAERLETRHSFMRRSGSGSMADDVMDMTDILEASNDDPMYHSSELTTMRAIRELGFTDLLRGDEVFGYNQLVGGDGEALNAVGFAQSKDLEHLLPLIRSPLREEARDAYEDLLTAVRESTQMQDPTNRKDYYYLTCRLLHVLHRSSYYKHTVMDVHLPWIDVDILNFYRRVPPRHRAHKRLFVKTVAAMFPDLKSIPYATRTSLEDWTDRLRNDNGLRSFLRDVLVEDDAALDGLLDPEAVAAFAESRLAAGTPARASVRNRLVGFSKEALRRSSPALYRVVKNRFLQRVAITPESPVPLLFRLVVARLWYRNLPTGQPAGS